MLLTMPILQVSPRHQHYRKCLPSLKSAISIRTPHTRNLIFTCENAWLYLQILVSPAVAQTPIAGRFPHPVDQSVGAPGLLSQSAMGALLVRGRSEYYPMGNPTCGCMRNSAGLASLARLIIAGDLTFVDTFILHIIDHLL